MNYYNIPVTNLWVFTLLVIICDVINFFYSGVGLALCERLLTEYPAVRLCLVCRNKVKGEAAMKALLLSHPGKSIILFLFVPFLLILLGFICSILFMDFVYGLSYFCNGTGLYCKSSDFCRVWCFACCWRCELCWLCQTLR